MLKTIAERWNLGFDLETMVPLLDKPSRMVNQYGISGISGWKESLSATEISRVLTITNAFGLSFYSESEDPDSTLLRSAELIECIKQSGQ